MMTTRRLGTIVLVCFGAVACGSSGGESKPEEIGQTAARLGPNTGDPGALVRMEMKSMVGVLLDEIPAGRAREAAAADALAKPTSFWTARAVRQARLTAYKLVFRSGYYPAALDKGPLPLPPKSGWSIDLLSRPHRGLVNGHDAIVVDYTFGAHILTDRASPGDVEPSLAQSGGKWSEHFTLPLDPEMLLERTGYACMDEFEYPLGSVFEENAHYFYDDTCAAERPDAPTCHFTQFPLQSCVEALAANVGAVTTDMRFKRIDWADEIANRVRSGVLYNAHGADLAVVREDIVEEHRTLYRWFGGDSCDLAEGTITAPGWRRILTFSASVRNDGTVPIHMGDVTDPANPWRLSNVFEFSACHQHYHFSHYGQFHYANAPGSKRAFCLEDTKRFHNDERTTLRAAHQTCSFQGITPGWGDEYQFGLTGQWVDITDVDTCTAHDLTFDSNPDAFLCEGNPVKNATGDLIFDPTSFRTSGGAVVSRLRCDKPLDWHADNVGAVSVYTPHGSYVTEPCTRGQVGPSRSCGFAEAPRTLRSCAAGSTVRLACTDSGPAQVLRVCEKSAKLGVGVACTARDASANVIVDGTATVSFTCPAVRDAASASTGGYALYGAPLATSQVAAPIHCTEL